MRRDAAEASGRLIRPGPVVFWAALGMVCIAFQVWVFGRWAADGGLHAMPPGGYEISSMRKTITWAVQIFVMAALAACAWWLARDCHRQGRVTYLAVLFFGYWTTLWSSPLSNYSTLAIASNRYSLNVTSWGPYIPGWHGPQAQEQVQSVILTDAGYVLLILWVWVVVAATIKIARRQPHWGLGRLALSAALVCFVFDAIVEAAYIRMGTYVYPRGLPQLTLFPGHWYQLPLSASFMVTIASVLPSVLVSLRAQATGREEWILQGSEKLPRRARPWAQLLAGAGFLNVCVVLSHTGWVLFSLVSSDQPPPDIPGYLRVPGT
ncbi:spirocyclase AveC family protein [Streptomyces syringium]|uniref:spirocyclase AveC family protein n=1 Tax=Streptomyces syringium TaxID=76729 RepID=UPI0034530342